MFWGLIMEPQKKYSQVVKKAFHISMAALDGLTSTNEPAQVMCGFDNRKYLLCTLKKDGMMQCALDLNFDVGTNVSFITNGNAHVHLTGYLVPDEALFDEEESEGEEAEQDADISLGTIDPSAIVTGKRQKTHSNQNSLPGVLGKELAALAANAPPAKKLKTMDMLNNVSEDDEDEDEDFSLTQCMEEEDDDGEDELIAEEEEEEDEDDENDGAEEVDAEEEDEEESVDGESVDEEEEEEEDDDDDYVMEEEVVAKQNGLAKKIKKDTEKMQKEAKPQKQKKQEKQQQQTKSPAKMLQGGVVVEDLREGTGAAAKVGKIVQVYYEGRLKSNNKVFDSSLKGNGFKFRLGRGEVIRGWDIGVVGMKVGGKRRITCPPGVAYGKKGNAPTIPGNSTLVFEVEMRNVN